MIGDKKVELHDENNLKVDDKIYHGTPRLWALIRGAFHTHVTTDNGKWPLCFGTPSLPLGKRDIMILTWTNGIKCM